MAPIGRRSITHTAVVRGTGLHTGATTEIYTLSLHDALPILTGEVPL